MKRMIAAALLLLLGAARARGAPDAPPAPLSVDDLMSIQAFTILASIGSLSPDGQWAAYAVRRCNPEKTAEESRYHGKDGMRAANAGCSDVWVANTRTGATERVSDGSGRAEDTAWSPDGTRLAFYAAQDGPAALWMWDRASRRARRVAPDVVRPPTFEDGARPRWMPDGKDVVAMLLPEGQSLDAPETPPAAHVEASGAPGGVTVFRSPAAPPAAAAPAPGASGASAAAGTAGASDDDPIQREVSVLALLATADLSLVNAETGAVRRLARSKPAFWFAPSPDGKWIAYSIMTGFRPKMNARVYAIEVVPTDGGPPRVLAEDVYPDDGVCTWSPDGRELAYVSGLEAEKAADVYVIDVASGKRRNLSPEVPKRASWRNDLVGAWTPDGTAILYDAWGSLWRIPARGGPSVRVVADTPDREIVGLLRNADGNGPWTTDSGRTVTVMTRNPSTKAMGFARVDVATGKLSVLREDRKDYGYAPPLVSADGRVVVYRAQDAQHPPDLFASDASFAAPRRITDLNPRIGKVRLGTARVVDYLGSEGQPLRGALLLPSGWTPGTRVPMIVEIYPGDYKHSNSVHRFGFGDVNGPFNKQMLATRGYAVLIPETPQAVGTPMRDLTANTNAAINRVVELGIADPDRLGVFGHSYGGFSTIAIVTQTPRYKAAVVSAGFADLTAFFGEIQESGLDAWANWVMESMGGSPWQYRSRYIENSPIFYLDRVTTPVLLLHGADDSTTRVFYAGQIFSGLRSLGREVEMRRYAGEGHVLERRENIVDYWNAVIRWYDTHLRKE